MARADISHVPALPELDFDPAFLARFDADAILGDRVELLHHEEKVDWGLSWREGLSTPLWRFNLHYQEYLLPLAKAFIDTGDDRYLAKAKAIVEGWISACPQGEGGAAWDPYVISMRAVNWLAFCGELEGPLRSDGAFVDKVNRSLAEQYVCLAKHLERDLLANHYLENLKALAILACYFGDAATLDAVVPLLEEQVGEQVLPDGGHFELSPMYQKIVLEDLLRVSAALRACGRPSPAVDSALGPMLGFVHSMERGAGRTPLFNDSGDNVAKSAPALEECAERRFALLPEYRDAFPDSGYYLLEGECAGRSVKVVFDAGTPGPPYAVGHAHCDMLSFEVFADGEPWIVNSGTFAYQFDGRLDFKRTASHNAPQVEGVEQSECWAPFRMARMARPLGVGASETRVSASMRDCEGNELARTVELTERGIRIVDECRAGLRLSAHLHVLGPVRVQGGPGPVETLYAPEFGATGSAWHVVLSGERRIEALVEPSGDGATLITEVRQ